MKIEEKKPTEKRARKPGNPGGKNQHSGIYAKSRGFRLSHAVDQKFEQVCERLGVSPTDAARVAIAEWVMSRPEI
jgi:hypothetical protein